MIERILPPAIASADAFGEHEDAELFPEEEAIVARAVDSRRKAFAAARRCARLAMAQLSIAPVAIPRLEKSAPRWPVGVVGSIALRRVLRRTWHEPETASRGDRRGAKRLAPAPRATARADGGPLLVGGDKGRPVGHLVRGRDPPPQTTSTTSTWPCSAMAVQCRHGSQPDAARWPTASTSGAGA